MEQNVLLLKINSTRECFNLTLCDCDILSKQGHTLSDFHLMSFILLAIVTVTANLLVIAALNVGKKCVELNGFKINAISLALTDLSIGSLCVPLTTLQLRHSWLLGDIACVVFKVIDYGLPTVSVLLMTAMACDRYKCVSSTLSYRSNFRVRRVVLRCIVLWISGIAVWIPGFVTLFFKQGSFIKKGFCRVNEYGYYSLIQTIFVLFLPLILTVVVYIKLGLNLRKRLQSGVCVGVVRPSVYSVSRDYCPGDQSDLAVATYKHKEHAGRTVNSNSRLNRNGQSAKPRHVKQRDKTLGLTSTRLAHAHISSQNRQCMITSLVVVIFFVVCWGPFGVLWPVYQMCKNCVDMDVYLASARLTYANSAINPFIYMFSSQRMRSLIKTLLVKLCCKMNS